MRLCARFYQVHIVEVELLGGRREKEREQGGVGEGCRKILEKEAGSRKYTVLAQMWFREGLVLII